MNKTIYLFFVILYSTYCKSQSVNSKVKSNSEKNTKYEDSVFTITTYDEGIINAIKNAQKNFDEFESAIKSENPNFKNFTLKKAYGSNKGYEYLWISPIVFNPKNNNYVGIISSKPLYTQEVKFDQIVGIEKNEISDWMYFDNGILKGGYTLRLLRDRMTDDERKAFDLESGYKFD